MTGSYEKDLDLNLLRVFVVVAEEGGVTAAAKRLYLTQPAVSAALRRLSAAVGAQLFVRSGRGVRLSARGERVFADARPHLEALVSAALASDRFDPTAPRTVRLGLSDSSESWLLPRLMRALAKAAPGVRLLIVPVQFRTVGEALSAGRIDLAVTVADDLPRGARRATLFHGSFTCLFDPRKADVGARLTRARYLAHEHVVVSYNADMRGVVEDVLRIERRVRVSIPSFHGIGAVVEGTALLATVPEIVAKQVVRERPRLRTTKLPFALLGTPVELLYPASTEDDRGLTLVRDLVAQVAREAADG